MKAYTLGLYEKAMPKTLTWKEKLEAARADMTLWRLVLMKLMKSLRDLIGGEKKDGSWLI